MTETEWATSDVPLLMIRAAQERVSARKWQLFCCALCRCAWNEITDAQFRSAVEVAERYADGLTDATHLLSWRTAISRFRAECAARRRHYATAGPPQWVVPVLYALNPVPRPTEAISLARPPRIGGESTDDWYGRARARNVSLLRDLLGNPFRPVVFAPEWSTDTAVTLARQMYESREFGAMPILADALQDAGCDSEEVLNHCRSGGTHVRGCWVCDLVLGKE